MWCTAASDLRATVRPSPNGRLAVLNSAAHARARPRRWRGTRRISSAAQLPSGVLRAVPPERASAQFNDASLGSATYHSKSLFGPPSPKLRGTSCSDCWDVLVLTTHHRTLTVCTLTHLHTMGKSLGTVPIESIVRVHNCKNQRGGGVVSLIIVRFSNGLWSGDMLNYALKAPQRKWGESNVDMVNGSLCRH